MRSAYLDASAAVKLLRAEAETAALQEALAETSQQVSSELLEVELCCVAWRLSGNDLLNRARAIVARIELVPYTRSIRRRAGAEFRPAQSALDAIHLATALDLGLSELVFVTYDKAQRKAAKAEGLVASTPA